MRANQELRVYTTHNPSPSAGELANSPKEGTFKEYIIYPCTEYCQVKSSNELKCVVQIIRSFP